MKLTECASECIAYNIFSNYPFNKIQNLFCVYNKKVYDLVMIEIERACAMWFALEHAHVCVSVCPCAVGMGNRGGGNLTGGAIICF